jgi:hypothetical protein
MELNNQQVNEIIDAAYALTNKLGQWFAQPSAGEERKDEEATLYTLSLIQEEAKALFNACPDMRDRQHTEEEINTIIAASAELLHKLSTSYKHADMIPEVMREEIKGLFIAFQNAGFIDLK